MRRVVIGLSMMLLTAAACGGGSDTTEPDPTPAPVPTVAPTTTSPGTAVGTGQATGCEELADQFISGAQGFLDVMGDASFDALSPDGPPPPDEWQTAGGTWVERRSSIEEQAASLGCADTLDQLICERQPQLDPQGDAGLVFVRDNTPCGVEATIGAAGAAEFHDRSEQYHDSQE
jgi:hypothetical protein